MATNKIQAVCMPGAWFYTPVATRVIGTPELNDLHWCPDTFGSIKCVVYPCPALAQSSLAGCLLSTMIHTYSKSVVWLFFSTATMSWHLTLGSGWVVMEADLTVFWWSVRWHRCFPAKNWSSATRNLFRLAINRWWSCYWVFWIFYIQRFLYVCRWPGNFLVTTGIMRYYCD